MGIVRARVRQRATWRAPCTISLRMDAPAMVTIRQSFRGAGTLIRRGVEVDVASYHLERDQYATDGTWRLTASLAAGSEGPLGALLASGPGRLQFRGETDERTPIFVADLRFERSRADYVEAACDDVAFGAPELPAVPTWQHIAVTLSPTPLARPEVEFLMRWGTGEVKPFRPKGPKNTPTPVWLETGVGRARFSLRYAHAAVSVGGERSSVAVPTPAVVGVVARGARTRDVQGLAERVAADLDDVLSVLSFLSRRFVRWTSLHVGSSRRRGGSHAVYEYERLRAVRIEPSTDRLAPLVNAWRLPPDALAGLVATYRALPYRDAAAAAIVYILAAHGTNVIDAQLAYGFTALEALVNALSEHDGSAYALTASQARALGKQLRPAIEAFAGERGLSDRNRDAVLDKLGELRRRPIVDRLVDLVERHAVEWRDLWGPDVSLADGFGAAYRRRNHFVHGGRIGHLLQASVDGRRAVVLGERLLYRLLGGDPAWHDTRTFEDARYFAHDERLVQDGQV